MSSGMPIAVVNGIGKFGAKKLAELLTKNDIRVIGVEEGLGQIEEIEEKIDYVFDFCNEEEAWELAVVNKSKLTLVGVNKTWQINQKLMDLEVNWRIVNGHGVFGPGMDNENEANVEVRYLIEAIGLAVRNKNLILPNRGALLRLMTETDLTEAILRASFLSGTERGVYDVWGKSINSEDLAKMLIDEAKMTRYKVVEGGKVENVPEEAEVENVWKKLRWVPQTELGEAMKETLQNAFSRADEEGRKPKSKTVKNYQLTVVSEEQIKPKIKPEKRFEVEIEKENSDQLLVNSDQQKKVEKKELEKLIEEEYKDVSSEPEIEEVEHEIKPILVKNSNARLVNSEKLTVISEEKPKQVEMKQEIIKSKTGGVKWMMWGWGILGGGWAMVVIMVLWWVVTNWGIYKNVLSIKQAVAESKYELAGKLIVNTMNKVKSQETAVEDWGWNQWTWGRRYQGVLKVTEQALMLGNNVISINRRAEEITQGLFKEKDINWDKELTGLKTDLDSLNEGMGMLEGRLNGDWGWVPGRWKNSLTNIRKQLAAASRMIYAGNKAVEVLPEILGTDGKRREYLMLFQNENELRPGGGFIGSYGVLSFEGGALKNFEIKDIYEADGQLKGHVEPPIQIKNYLGEAKWYMRDANWQADFVANSKDIQWFFEKETGRKVDGVIGVNLAVAKGMLGVIGEVYVPDFKEKINKDNLYEQAEFYSETKFFPGSNQKASFLGGLGKQLFEEVKNMKGEKRMEMVKIIMDLAERNELQIALNNKKAATVISDLGWDGSIYGGKCLSKSCFADYLYIVEANLGVNKANYFLYRNIEQTVEIGSQAINRVLKITYENTSKSVSWPGGDYKNYLRVYIPESANIAEVSVTDVATNGLKTIYSGENLAINTVKGKKEVGLLVVVPVAKKRVVEIRYLDQIDLNGLDKFSYLNYIQKQSGFGDTGMVNLVTLPEGWQPNQVEPTASLVNGKLLFNQKLDRDIKMGVEIGK